MSCRAPFALVLSFCAFTHSIRSQCVDPPVPSGGFVIQEDLNVSTVWTDGYAVLMDVRYPTAAAGACGWPLIVCVHGSGGSKAEVAGVARNLAEAGYITLAYDVRGQGPSSPLNPLALQHSLNGLRELVDLFEAMEAAEAIYPLLTDSDRIGVTGYSQGGGHSWNAAMHSGRLPPPNPWRMAAFPVVSAVVAKDAGAQIDSPTPTAFSNNRVEKFFGAGGVNYANPAPAQAAILAENFAALDALTTAPGMDGAILLPLTAVPVYVHSSYDDKRINPSGVLTSWSLLPATTPKRLQAGTSGHDSPHNDLDFQIFGTNRRAWFNRFLKNMLNGIAQGPPIVALVTPEDVPTYQDPASLWDFRHLDVLPPAATVTQTYFLGPAGNLLGAPPAGGGASQVIHGVPGWLNIAAYTAWLPTAGQLAGAIVPSAVAYDSAPLTQDRHLQGIATVSLAVNNAQPDYQLQAVLFDVDPMGQARWICAGRETVRGTPGNNVVTINTYLQSYVLRQGHSLRLQIENLGIHRPPTGSAAEIKDVPVLTSSVTNILEGAPVLSSITIPFLPFPGPRLVTNLSAQSVAGLQNQRMTIHTDSSYGAMPYILGASFSGSSPGTPIGGTIVPLNIDPLTLFMLANPFAPPFVNIIGNLGPTGSATAGFQFAGLVLPPAFIGLEVSMAAVIVTPAIEATNATSFTFVP